MARPVPAGDRRKKALGLACVGSWRSGRKRHISRGTVFRGGSLETCYSEYVLRDCKINRSRAQRIPSSAKSNGPPKKAGYICADQTVILTFRLQGSGGTYVPCRQPYQLFEEAPSQFMRHSANLDLLRSVAVSVVLADHLALTLFRPSPLNESVLKFAAAMGQAGVLAFFVHTSLVLMYSLQRMTRTGRQVTLRFYVRRFFRIYPLSIFCIALALVFHVPDNPRAVRTIVTLPIVFSNLLLIRRISSGREYYRCTVEPPVRGSDVSRLAGPLRPRREETGSRAAWAESSSSLACAHLCTT